MWPRRRVALLLVSGAMVLAGCGVLPGSGVWIHLDNLTNTPVALHVNGTWVGTYAPGTSSDVPLGGVGGPPYLVTVHSPSGRELTQFEVSANDVKAAADDMGGSSATVGVRCGTIRIAFGPIDSGPVVAPEPGPDRCP